MYGPTEAIAPGAMAWGGVDTSSPHSAVTGGKVPDPFGTSPDTNSKITGGRRRRGSSKRSKRQTKKKGGRRHRRRTMKGGSWSPNNVNAAGVGYGFSAPQAGVTGGIAPATGYASRVGGAPMNADGTRSA